MTTREEQKRRKGLHCSKDPLSKAWGKEFCTFQVEYSSFSSPSDKPNHCFSFWKKFKRYSVDSASLKEQTFPEKNDVVLVVLP